MRNIEWELTIEVEMAQPEELWEESWGDEMSVSVV
jgi:hypothetical protein